jgi:hypothetical protein
MTALSGRWSDGASCTNWTTPEALKMRQMKIQERKPSAVIRPRRVVRCSKRRMIVVIAAGGKPDGVGRSILLHVQVRWCVTVVMTLLLWVGGNGFAGLKVLEDCLVGVWGILVFAYCTKFCAYAHPCVCIICQHVCRRSSVATKTPPAQGRFFLSDWSVPAQTPAFTQRYLSVGDSPKWRNLAPLPVPYTKQKFTEICRKEQEARNAMFYSTGRVYSGNTTVRSTR